MSSSVISITTRHFTSDTGCLFVSFVVTTHHLCVIDGVVQSNVQILYFLFSSIIIDTCNGGSIGTLELKQELNLVRCI